jgi:hypothetical protein
LLTLAATPPARAPEATAARPVDHSTGRTQEEALC